LTVNFGQIGGLDFHSDTDELLSDSVLGGSVEHLGFDFGAVRSPHDKEDLVSLTTIGVVFEVVDRISAIVGGESFDEVVVCSAGRSGDIDDDLLLISGQLEQSVSKRVSKLEFLVLVQNVIRNSDSGRHVDLG